MAKYPSRYIAPERVMLSLYIDKRGMKHPILRLPNGLVRELGGAGAVVRISRDRKENTIIIRAYRGKMRGKNSGIYTLSRNRVSFTTIFWKMRPSLLFGFNYYLHCTWIPERWAFYISFDDIVVCGMIRRDGSVVCPDLCVSNVSVLGL